jgi:hypothetical protein
MDYAIQVITLSVTDVDKAAAFYFPADGTPVLLIDDRNKGTASTEAAASSQLTECRERLMAVMPTVAIRP